MCVSICIYFIQIEYVCEIYLQSQIDFPIGLKIETKRQKKKRVCLYFEIFTRTIYSLISHTHMKLYFLTNWHSHDNFEFCVRFVFVCFHLLSILFVITKCIRLRIVWSIHIRFLFNAHETETIVSHMHVHAKKNWMLAHTLP